MDIKITSPSFEDGGMIPSKYTCDGEDISPLLQWDAVPDGTASIAVISDDPDALYRHEHIPGEPAYDHHS